MVSHHVRGHPGFSGSPEDGHAARQRLPVGYFLLIISALAALWYGGVLGRLSTGWVVIGLVIAVGLGVMLFLTAGKPVTRD